MEKVKNPDSSSARQANITSVVLPKPMAQPSMVPVTQVSVGLVTTQPNVALSDRSDSEERGVLSHLPDDRTDDDDGSTGSETESAPPADAVRKEPPFIPQPPPGYPALPEIPTRIRRYISLKG